MTQPEQCEDCGKEENDLTLVQIDQSHLLPFVRLAVTYLYLCSECKDK